MNPATEVAVQIDVDTGVFNLGMSEAPRDGKPLLIIPQDQSCRISARLHPGASLFLILRFMNDPSISNPPDIIGSF